eukprot:scaffold294418_cov17-Tisochrysis_lutea.AAC.2
MGQHTAPATPFLAENYDVQRLATSLLNRSTLCGQFATFPETLRGTLPLFLFLQGTMTCSASLTACAGKRASMHRMLFLGPLPNS